MLDVTNIATYRYFTADLLTGAVIMEIPFGQVSWERKISAAGSFSGTISADPNEDHFDLYDTTMPGKYALYVLRDNVCVWGGIIWSRDYSIMDKKLTVSALEFTSYLYHRILWKTMTIPSDGTTNIASLISDLLTSTLTDQLAIDDPISYLASDTYSLVNYFNKSSTVPALTYITEEAHSFAAGDSVRIKNVGTNLDSDAAVVLSSPAPTDYTFSISPNSVGGRTFLLYGTGTTLKSSTDTVTWVTRNPNTSSSQIRGAAYGNSTWLITGLSGALRASTDAITWVTRSNTFGSNSLYEIVFADNKWLLKSDNSLVFNASLLYTSTDTVTWVTRTSNFGSTYISSIAYGNGLWVAGGGFDGTSGEIRASTDAVTWVTRTSNFGTSQVYSVAHNGLTGTSGLWIATGYNGTLRTSTDTITWVTRNANTGASLIAQAAYGNGLWVIVGNALVRRSTDAITWVTSNAGFTSFVRTISYLGDTWLATADYGVIKSSTDAVTWVTRSADISGSTIIIGVASSNVSNYPYSLDTNIPVPSSTGAYAIKKATFDTLQSSSNLNISIDTSTSQFTELKDYTLVGSGDNNPFTFRGSDMKYVGEILQNFSNSGVPSYGYKNSNTYIATGSGATLRRSTDTVNWVTLASTFGDQDIQAAAYGNGLFLIGNNSGILRTSTDAITWVTRASNLGAGVFISSLAYAQGVWVMTGPGSIRTSTDAITWTTRTSTFGSSGIRSVAYGNGAWVAGGDSGQLRTSTDAITWVTRVSNFGTSLIWTIAHNGLTGTSGLWLAGGAGGQLRASTDAITWVTRAYNTIGQAAVAYGNGIWVAADDYAVLRTSTDTITWVTRAANFGGSPIYTVKYLNGLWFLGGASEQLRTSTDAITWVTQLSNFGSTSIVSSIQSFTSGLARNPDYTRKNTRFDYYIESSFDPATETFSNEFKAWLVRKDNNNPLQGVEVATDLTELYGPSGFGANGLVFEHPGNIANITLGESAETAATRTWVMDSSNDLDSDASKYYASYTNLNYLGYNWPLLEAAVTGRDLPASRDIDVLPYAKAIGYRLSPPIGQYNVTVNGSLEPTVGTYRPGDWCVVVVGDQFVNNRLKPPYENRENILVRKIKSFKVSVPDNPQFPEVVELELVPEWEDSE